MAGVSSEDLRDAIRKVLKGADLNALSAKKVRKELEEQFDEDFTSRKKEIDKIVIEVIEENQKDSQSNDEGSEDEDSDSASSMDEPAPKKPAKKEISLPPPPKKVKKESASEASESELDDEALARKLQDEERLPRRRAAIKQTKPRKRNTSDKPKSKKVGGSNSLYSRNCILSESLAEVVGAKEMPRHGVVKKIWEVVRERNLFDPKNKRYAVCDEQLQKIFENRKRILLFGMMKYLKNHIIDSDQ